MKKNDFSKGKRGQVIPQTHKTRVTIYLDDTILAHFKKRAAATGKGYQTLINEALRHAAIGAGDEMLTPKVLRRIVREELGSRNS
ncbi:MAG TPA: BrnA antitoxin family protein [Candidatus Binatia bacterium]|jgi:uncharacterized protein (DUF4415 family)